MISVEEAQHRPLITDQDVQERIELLVGRACRRQLWLMFLDRQFLQLPVLIPIADYPLSPGEGVAELMAARILEVLEATGGAQVVLVWERRLSENATAGDKAWASQLAIACAARDIAVRAQLISHKTGVRWFPPDDYL